MKFYRSGLFFLTALLLILLQNTARAQRAAVNWTKDGYQYYRITGGQIIMIDARDTSKKLFLLPKKN
ncbi:hypothetical protein ACRQ5D_10325 [Mucilaginibacter sp. P25]|uniref:hypothetical protein n=1 Tax=Mucilaginibacter sp. P25 TaxID=3423945 RepID=UPI003D794B83